MPRLLEVADLCSRMVSDPANRLLKRTDSEGSPSAAEEKSSVVPLFSKRSPLSDFRRAIKQGKGRSSKRKGNRRCPFLFAPRGGRRDAPAAAAANPPAEVQRKTLRPVRANPPAAVRVPRSAGAGKGAARQGRTRLRQFVCPGHLVPRKKAPQNCFHGAQSMHFYSNRSSVSTSLRAGACGSCAG